MEKLTLNDFNGDVEQYEGYLEIYRIMEEMERQRSNTVFHDNLNRLSMVETPRDDTNSSN